MLFSRKSTATLHVMPDKLAWYGKDQKPDVLNVPPEVFRYLEVTNETEAGKLLEGFISKRVSKGQKVVVVLADSVVFSSVLRVEKTPNPAEAAQSFIDAVPLDPAARVALSVPGRTNWFVVSTNKQWLVLIARAVQQSGGSVTHVVPVSSYGIVESQTFEPQTIAQLSAPNKTAQRFDFMPLL